jgi:hypothetical protein
VIDAIWSWHTNPLTCGVAKWNHALAKRLGVPCESLRTGQAAHPLISIKTREAPGTWHLHLPRHVVFDLLFHDAPDIQRLSVVRPLRVFAANHEIAEAVRPIRHDVIELWCPSTLDGNLRRGTINIWTFGMAHKIQLGHFARLKSILDATPDAQDYTICQSVAIHEGSSWDDTFTETARAMLELFGEEHLRFLGFLADDALVREMREAQAVALFYDPAVRANHTTVWAALELGTPVITNLDRHSPPELAHYVSVFDIDQLTEWPLPDRRSEVRAAGRKAADRYSWERLLPLLTA